MDISDNHDQIFIKIEYYNIIHKNKYKYTMSYKYKYTMSYKFKFINLYIVHDQQKNYKFYILTMSYSDPYCFTISL